MYIFLLCSFYDCAFQMTIIVFTYMYCSNMATTECYIHSLTVFQAMNRRMGKFLVSVNFIINTIMVSTMIFSTAVVLKRSAVTVMDIVLNSTAIYFIADLDDMMISSTDEEILDERILFTYIYHLIDLSKKVDKGEICQFLKEERWWIIFQHYGMIALLGFSFYIYFGSNFPSWMESGPLSN
uniref:Uncharacterized protein n=1 Tax=Heterosigma akashiwo TaxID=2829 RepID=A0A6V1PX21_HETAK